MAPQQHQVNAQYAGGGLTEKDDTIHIEDGPLPLVSDMDKSERAPEARGREASEMPKGYFYSAKFIGAYCAIGFGFMAATGGYAL